MQDKEEIYKIILLVWDLFKKYGFKKLNDSEWEELIKYGLDNQDSFGRFKIVFVKLFGAVEEYYKLMGE